jgi:hypothetical protein
VQLYSSKTDSANPFQIHDEKAKLKTHLQGFFIFLFDCCLFLLLLTRGC